MSGSRRERVPGGRARGVALLLLLAACATAPKPASPPLAESTACPTKVPDYAGDSRADDLWGKKIEQICVVGASEETTTHLLKTVIFRQGTPLDEKNLSTDLQILFVQVVLRDVTALAEPLEGSTGVRLTYVVSEYPRFTELAVAGNRSVGEDVVRSAVELGLPANPVVLKAAVEEVKQSYASIGFAQTRVDYSLEDTKPGQVKLKLQIDEGHRFTVGAIRIEGAKVVKQDELKKALRTGVGGPYTEELAERDAMALNAVLFDHGLVQSSVTALAPSDAPQGNGAVELVFKVTEGDVFKIGKLKLTGFDLGPEKDVFKVMETKSKQVFSRSAITRDIERLKHLAQQKGVSIDVLPLTEVNTKDRTIDLTFSLEKQPEQRIRF